MLTVTSGLTCEIHGSSVFILCACSNCVSKACILYRYMCTWSWMTSAGFAFVKATPTHVVALYCDLYPYRSITQ